MGVVALAMRSATMRSGSGRPVRRSALAGLLWRWGRRPRLSGTFLLALVCVMLLGCSPQAERIKEALFGSDGYWTTPVSAESVDPSDCEGSASKLGRAFSDDVLAIWDGTFDRSRVVIQVRTSYDDLDEDDTPRLVRPLTNDYVPIQDLTPLYILPAYPTAWVRLSTISGEVPTCVPSSWATNFINAIDEAVLEKLGVAEPPFGPDSSSASDLIRPLAEAALRFHYCYLEAVSPELVPLVDYEECA